MAKEKSEVTTTNEHPNKIGVRDVGRMAGADEQNLDCG